MISIILIFGFLATGQLIETSEATLSKPSATFTSHNQSHSIHKQHKRILLKQTKLEPGAFPFQTPSTFPILSNGKVLNIPINSRSGLIVYNESYVPNYPLPAKKYQHALGEDFLYGFASAAVQVEGGSMVDGKSLSIWDKYASIPGKISDGTKPDDTNDEYHLLNETIAMLKMTGSNVYRFSISWARIVPGGFRGSDINENAVAHYNVLIDALIENGITPFVTIYHWDLPQILQDSYEGFLDSERFISDYTYFAEYLFIFFGDRVKFWLTFNEPASYCLNGYTTGEQAPGNCITPIKCTWKIKFDLQKCVHTTLLAHARIVDIYRRKYKPEQNGLISIALNGVWTEPLDPSSEADIQAAQLQMDYTFSWFADPIFLTGDYPESMKKRFSWIMPELTQYDKLLLKGSADFFALNQYTSSFTTRPSFTFNSSNSFGSSAIPFHFKTTYSRNGHLIGRQGGNDWIYDTPVGFRSFLEYIDKRYNHIDIYVSENGFAVRGEPEMPLHSILHDRDRVAYFQGYLKNMMIAVKESGVSVKAYIAWTLMDNWEWSTGFTNRFGVAYVDRSSGVRMFKDSAYYLKSFFNYTIKPKHNHSESE